MRANLGPGHAPPQLSVVGGNKSGAAGRPPDDPMEARVAKLETTIGYIERDVSEMRSDMKDVRDRLGRLETNVSHLPSKGFIWTAVLLALAVVGALTALQGQIQALLGTAP